MSGQTTDPLAGSNREPNPTEWPNGQPAEDALPPVVRDPGKGNVPAGTPLWRGSQSSDFK